DIHNKTAMALPILLKELKANGYNVVHVVAEGERPTSIPEPIASSTSDGKPLPAEHANTSSGDHALATRQNHRIKKHSATRHQPPHWYYPSGSNVDRMSALGQ